MSRRKSEVGKGKDEMLSSESDSYSRQDLMRINCHAVKNGRPTPRAWGSMQQANERHINEMRMNAVEISMPAFTIRIARMDELTVIELHQISHQPLSSNGATECQGQFDEAVSRKHERCPFKSCQLERGAS